jgi:MscS family membrane protein
LPFPHFPRSELERLDGSLDYPPYGSPDAEGEEATAPAGAEPLSSPAARPSSSVDPNMVEEVAGKSERKS